jgi:transposase-like protein
MASKLSQELAEEVISAVDEAGGNRAEAARSLGVTRTLVYNRLQEAKRLYNLEPQSNSEKDNLKPSMRSVETKNTKQIWMVEDAVCTEKQALAKAGIDESIWEVVKITCNQYQVALRQHMGHKERGVRNADKLHTKSLWQIKIELKRRVIKSITDAIELIHKKAEKYSPKYTFPAIKKPHGDIMAVMCLFDHHFGKLCWSEETGEDYDLKIAVKVWNNALEDLLAYIKPLGVKKFLFPVGQDFINFDNEQGTTTAGTPQDNDSRYAKVIDAAYWCLVHAAERLAPIAPVEFEYVTGNHDLTASYHLARELKRHYRNTNRIEVGIDFRKRKYILWGKSLLGLSHAENVKAKWETLPALMATEEPIKWSASTHREWLLGHEHCKQKKETLPASEKNGVVMRTVSSLSGRDYWHYDKGYMSNRACESYLYSEANGYVGHFNANVRE